MPYKVSTVTADKIARDMRIPYVHTGYRLPYQHWSYYVRSLFHVHNETINVWTHLIGCFLVAIQIYIYYNLYSMHEAPVKGTVLAFGICCLITLFNSATAHLLHSRSCHANYLIFMFDYIGVVSWGFGTAILAVYGVSKRETYEWIGPHFVTGQVFITYINFINICFAKLWFGHDVSSTGTRKMMIVTGISLQGLLNFIPWFPRYTACFYDPSCTIGSLNHVSLVCVSFTCMTLTFVLHQPEKLWPGKFDIFGQSHQIFHVFVISTMSLQFRALYIDFVLKNNAHCNPNVLELISYIFVLNAACLVTIFFMRSKVKRKLDWNNKKS